MRIPKPRCVCTGFLILAVLALLDLTTHGAAFAKGGPASKDGNAPLAGLISDARGNLYGTTDLGGAFNNGAIQGDGAVFELTPNGTGGWTESIIHSFNGTDGKFPASGLIFDSAGNLYGTTIFGGANGNGTVFKLAPPTKGSNWTESVLLSFNGTIGGAPHAALSMDSSGNLYGTTQGGGTSGLGTVFKLTKSGSSWTSSVLYNFTGVTPDGSTPDYTALTIDAAGHLYGTTAKGGNYGAGTVFKLTNNSGVWTESSIYSFVGTNSDGAYPVGLILGADGNFYGAARHGGPGVSGDGVVPPDGAGTVFALTNNAGTWSESLLSDFSGLNDGDEPYAGVIRDTVGNLYGTTQLGGTGHGVAFELTAAGTYSVLHTFAGGITDGDQPSASLIMIGGNLYGTTTSGGTYGGGTVFKLTNNAGVWSESVIYNFIV